MDLYIRLRSWWIACAICAVYSIPTHALAAEEEIIPELSQVGALIDYARDVEPIMAAKCLKCHGPEEAKNDFRVDEAETLLSYVEPGDVEGSSLWSDYLVTDDPDMRMPPTSVDSEEQLTGAELATIKLWIEEGGMWNAVAVQPVVAEKAETLSLPARIWRFQGLFHPATTHFPIALLTVSAGFVLLSFVRPDTCEPVAFHCLWIGALGAIVASAAGWSYAVYEGYGPSASFDLQNSAIDRHRWLGIGVSVLAVILIPVAMYVRRTEDSGMRFIWLLGSLLLLAAVGTSGYQGGELTYGEGHYEKEFVKYFPNAFPTADELDVEGEVSGETTEEVIVVEENEMSDAPAVVAEDHSAGEQPAKTSATEVQEATDTPPSAASGTEPPAAEPVEPDADIDTPTTAPSDEK